MVLFLCYPVNSTVLHDPLYSVLIQDIYPWDAYPKAESERQMLKWGWILRKGANLWLLQWRWETSKSRFLHLPYVVGGVQLLNRVQLFVTPWTADRQVSLSFTISWSLFKLMSIESIMPPNHFILYHPLLLLPSIFPSIRVFCNELALCIRRPKYWSFSFSIIASNEYLGLISCSINAEWMNGWMNECLISNV